MKKLHQTNDRSASQPNRNSNEPKDITAGIIAILAALANFPIDDEYIKSLKVFRDVMEEDAWTFKEFKSAYGDIPELVELTTTPFMTNIGRSNFVRGSLTARC